MDEYKRRRRRSRAVMSMFLDSLGGSIDNVDVATFDSDGSDLKALVVGIESVQSGTGDPSPDNIRPISGHSSVNVIVSPTLNPLEGTIANVPLGTTVYGGTLDVITGVLTVDMAMVDLGTLTWASWLESGTLIFNAEVDGKKQQRESTLICSQYKPNYTVSIWVQLLDCEITGASNSRVYIRDQRFTDNAAFTTAMSGVQLVYELATPQTIQLTGQQIATFLGTNNVWCSSGKIIHLEY